jgi:hypothetical protein
MGRRLRPAERSDAAEGEGEGVCEVIGYVPAERGRGDQLAPARSHDSAAGRDPRGQAEFVVSKFSGYKTTDSFIYSRTQPEPGWVHPSQNG